MCQGIDVVLRYYKKHFEKLLYNIFIRKLQEILDMHGKRHICNIKEK